MSDLMNTKKEINNFCRQCQRTCKQQAGILLVECRHYLPVPVQLTFKFKAKSEIRKKKK